MALAIKEELTKKIHEFAQDQWGDITNANVLPTIDDLPFGNTGEHLAVTVLYADISESTAMVDELLDTKAAEYYKSFLHCASQPVKQNSGEIQAYDGDRVMALYVGEKQADNAVKTALEINFAVVNIINPTFEQIYPRSHRKLQFTIGIDSGTVLAIKVGVRTVGELAWIGGAANYAAKLNRFEGIDHNWPIRITSLTFEKLTKYRFANGLQMWDGPYNNLKKRDHYRTKYYLPLS